MRNTTTYTASVAGNVRAALARHDKTQRWLADASGINEATLHRRLRGHSPFLVDEIVAVAQALGIDPGELLPQIEGGAA